MLTTDSDNLVHITLGSTSLAILAKYAFDIFKNGRNGRNGKSGDKPAEFWEAKFDKLDGHAVRQTDILKEQTGILREMAQGQSEFNKNIAILLERTK